LKNQNPEASNIKLVFNGHGDDKGLERTTADRTYRDIVNDIVTLREALPKTSNIFLIHLNQRGICKRESI
jgi:hypothetical protein